MKTGFGHLGGQKALPREPGRFQNAVPNRVRVDKGEFHRKCMTLCTKTLFSRVQGFQHRSQNRSKIGSHSHLRRGGPQKASGEPLGTLLEASGAGKKKLGTALGRLGAKKVAKMRTQKISCTPIFYSSKSGSKIGPPFYGLLNPFLRFPMAFLRLCKSTFGCINDIQICCT